MTRPLHRARALALALLAAVLVLPLGIAGCRSNAPDDLINQVRTTQALVFVKSKATETLNKSWADANLYKLSPISPDGVVTPVTTFTGAAISALAGVFEGERRLLSSRPPGGT